MKKTNIFVWLSLMTIILCGGACKDETEDVPHISATPSENCTVEAQDASLRIVVDANCKWKVETDAEWCSVYPPIGEDEGRFIITPENLNSAYSRQCNVTVSSLDGSVRQVIPLTQNGVGATLAIDHTSISTNSAGDNFTVNITTNVHWNTKFVSIDDPDNSWVTLGEKTETTLSLTISENISDNKRKTVLRFYQEEDPEVYRDLTITQIPQYLLSNSTNITVKDLLTTYTGIVEDNLYVEGYVTSDRNVKNTASNQMYLQDDSGKGLLLEFTDASKNKYDLNTPLKVWLAGCEIKIVDGVTKIQNIGESNIYTGTSLTGTKAEPVTVDNIAHPALLENTLVTLNDMAFTTPLGALYNSSKYTIVVDENNQKISPALTADYSHLLRDSEGNHIELMTLATFPDYKKKNIIPTGNCNITGIIMNKGGKTIIRVRKTGDIVESVARPIIYKSIAEWYQTKSYSASMLSWEPAVGTGTFTIRSNYNANGQVLDSGTGYDVDSHAGPQIRNWFMTGEGEGQTWNFSTSTMGVTGDVYLSLWMASADYGPRDFVVEWSENGTKWTESGRFECWSYNPNTTTHPNMCKNIDLRMDGVQGKENLQIRLRVVSQAAANQAVAKNISNASTNRIVYIGLKGKQK